VRTGDAVASTLFVHYVLSVARQSNVSSLMRLLPLLSAHYDADIVYSDTTLHSLISALSSAPLSDAFANTEFCDIVFTKFFVVSAVFHRVLATHLEIRNYRHFLQCFKTNRLEASFCVMTMLGMKVVKRV